MSKTETPNTPTVETQKFVKKYEFYDENLNLVTKDVPVEFKPAETYEEAVTRLNNDAIKLLAGLNAQLRREAFSEARKAAGVSGGINRAVLMEYIKPFREFPQFAAMLVDDAGKPVTDKRKASVESWNKQTQAIIDQIIKPVPMVIDGIKARSAQVSDEDDE